MRMSKAVKPLRSIRSPKVTGTISKMKIRSAVKKLLRPEKKLNHIFNKIKD